MNDKINAISMGLIISLFPFYFFQKEILLFIVVFTLFISAINIRLQIHNKNAEIKKLSILSAIISCSFLITAVSSEPVFIGYLISVIAFILCQKQVTLLKYILGGFTSFLLLTCLYNAEWYNIYTVIITVISISTMIYLLSQLLDFRLITSLLFLLFAVLKIASVFFVKYRFQDLTVGDILSLTTALGVMSEYKIKITMAGWITIILSFIFSFLFFTMTQKAKMKSRKMFGFTVLCFILSTNTLATRAQSLKELGTDIYRMNFYESLTLSAVNELKTKFIHYDLKEEKEKVEKYADDENRNPVNIVSIMCESYADIEDIYNVTLSRDPMKSFEDISGANVKKGMLSVDTIGGGTVKSEWEYLTGLDIKKINGSQTVFSSMEKDYTFTADEFYDIYEKTIYHPYLEIGYNRKEVYEMLGYENRYFLDDYEYWKESDTVRNFIADHSVYDKIKEQLEKTDRSQFIFTITMQNHGDYAVIDDENKIRVKEDIENAEKIETYTTLVEHSSEDIKEFVNYLNKHPENPTLVIFFGDHQPGGLVPVDGEEFYETPYMVYSNFGNVDDLPEKLDLSLLYPFAKKAAGLPLSAYEKYLCESKELPDKKFIAARMENGYF